jgi:hypothetical protein
MPNITTTTAATFIPEIWAQTALQALRSRIRLAKRVTKDSDVATFTTGDVLHLTVPGTFVANNKTANGNVTTQSPTDGEVTVTLNQHKEVTILVEDVVRAQANQNLMERYARNAVIPLANAIEDALFALYAGFSTSTGTNGTDVTPALMRTAGKILDDANVDEEDRFMVLSTKDHAAILGASELSAYFANANAQAITDAQVRHVLGFDVLKSNRVPVVVGSPNSTKNLAGTGEMALLAMRGLPTDGIGVEQINVTDEESGLVIRQTSSYNANALGWQITWDVLYGVAEMRDACGLVVLS